MKTTIFILIILISSCKSEKEQAALDWNIPVINDSLPKSKKFFKTNRIRSPFNQLIYIGAKHDSISISENSLNLNPFFSEFSNPDDTLKVAPEIEIVPDLTQDLSIDTENFSFPPPPVIIEGDEFEIDERKTDSIFKIWKERPRNYVKAYPVFIRNITNDTLDIDNQDGDLFLIGEAQTKNGDWKPIEYWRYSTCGNSYATTTIGPNDILVIKKIKYKGTFKTKLRLKLKTGNKIVYSEPYNGSINVEQFDAKELNVSTKGKLENKEYRDLIFLNN